MTPVTVEQLKRVLVMLEPERFAYLVRGYLKVQPHQAKNVPLLVQLKLMLADWMHYIGFISDQQQQLILTRRSRDLAEYQAFLGIGLDDGDAREELPSFVLTISDMRYVSTTANEFWLDLQIDEEIPELPDACITHVNCDVTALYLKTMNRIRQIYGGTDADKSHKDVRNSNGD